MKQDAVSRALAFRAIHVAITLICVVAVIGLLGGPEVFAKGIGVSMALAITVVFIGTAVKFGPVPLRKVADVKAALLVSVTWPRHILERLDRECEGVPGEKFRAFLNGIYIGELESAEYWRIVRSVLRDPAVYVAQSLNVVWTFMCVIAELLIVLPLLAFGLMVFLAYWEPTIYMQVFRELSVGAEGLRNVVRVTAPLWIMVGSLSVLLRLFVFFRLPGFQNKYSERINRCLRAHFQAAAAGDVVIAGASTVLWRR